MPSGDRRPRAGGRALRFDAEQRFTCQRCGRCCRGWDVMLTAGEVAAYRRTDVARLWSADSAGEPFAPVPGHPGLWRLGKRGDGSCGFLSPAGLCRIHEELGAAKKPLACRMFPFRLRPSKARRSSPRASSRGFLLAVVAARVQARGPRRGLRFGLRWRLTRLALHLHGLWPATEGVNLAAAHSARLDLGDPSLHGLVHHYLRSNLETLPTGRRPVVDEIAYAFATLNAGRPVSPEGPSCLP